MDLRPSSLQAAIVRLEQAQRVTPFGLDMKVLLTTEATGGAISVLVAWHKPGEGQPDHVHFTRKKYSSSSKGPQRSSHELRR